MMAPKRNLRSGSRAGPKQNSNRTPPPSIETLKEESGSEFEDDEGEQSDDDAFNDHVSEKEPSDDDKQASEESDEDTKSDHESNQAEDDDVASDEETAEIESDGEIKHGGKVTNKKVSGANANAVKASGDNFTWRAGIDGDTEPFDTIEKMYQDLLRKSQEDPDFNKFLDSGKVIRIATMCSGTECPIIALELIEELLANDEKKLQHEQCFSAEIVPFKQAYIRRNWPQVTIFRDIVELAQAVNPGPETSEQEQEAKRAKTSKAARQQLKVPEGITAYGSKAPVPGSLDILVAGFCCVDFSRLNNKKLTLEQRGESGDTLFAILAFIEKQRPKLVLLENVLSAPWTDEKVRKKHLQDLLIQEKVKKPSEEKLKELQDRIDEGVKNHFLDSGIDKLMLEIGYLAKYVILDAKDYYMPHTRERGYMLCVDLGVFATVDGVTNAMSRKRKPENKADQKHSAIQQAKSRLAEWENKVTALKHKATVPAEQLLMAATDTVSSSISHVEEANEEKEKERANHAWVSTKAKMEQYRDDLELGHRRRLTFWNEAGYKRLLDFWTPMSGMSQRVLDVLDICHLRNIRRGFDDRYYSRLLDLSQNVYRNIDRTRSGIIPCLTPSGIPWWTSAGRRIAGREALLLQGLPVDRIDLSYLTEANMQDLTGNAMTSTVVASAMLAAFATFAKELEGTTSKTRQAVKVDAPMEIIPSPTTNISPTTILRPISVERAKLLAKSTCQLCTCESSAKKLEKDFHRCKVCEHTVCTEHKGNCEHKYAKINSTEKFARRYPFTFIDRIKESIPRSITISNDCSAALRFIYSAEKTYEDSGLTVDDLESVLEFALLLKSFKRSRCWEITYESSHAKLVLEIAAHGIEWLLYAKSPTHLSLNDPRRVYRDRFPLARLRPTGDDITKGQWEIWAPNVVATSVNLRFEGKLIPSFESGRGLVQFANTYVFETFTIAEGDEFERQFGASIDGQYKLSPACGQAFDSLHLRDTSIPSEPPLFFMFDHQPQTGDPKKHYFVFTNNINKLAFGVHRQIVASLNSEFKYPMIKESTLEGPKYHITNRTDILAKEVTSGHQVRPPHVDTQAIITSHGNWTPTTSSLGIGLYSTTGNEKVCGDFSDWEDLSCKAYRQVFEGRCKIPKDAALEFLQDNWILVNQRNEAAFFGRFGYLCDRELVQKPHIEDSTTWLQSTTSTDICLSCAPKQPDILWAWEKDEQKPFEDLEHTADYEIALKERPSPIQAVYRVTTNDTLDLVIRINPETLVHRALSLLMDASDCSEVHSSWRLVTDDCSFYDKALVKYSLLNTADEDPIELKKLANESELRSEQIKTVSWAVKQEESPEPFIEEEVVESRIPKLRYRLMGKAERSVVRRGGILASEVGYGKTAVVLALANHQKKADIARTKVEEEFAKTSDTPGLISIKATLILMPSHLVDQWVGEAKKFLPSQTEIIAIKTITSLRSKTIYEMQKADIIIMSWSVCEGPQYATALAQVAGMIDPDSKASPRAMTSWYQAALGKVKENVRLLRRPPNDMTTFDELVHKQIDEELANLQQNHRMVPSKRLTGSNLQKAKAQKKLQKSSGPNTKSKINLEVPKINHFESLKPAARQAMKWAKAKDWQYMRHLVLEMFKFSRIVVDEYHYASDKVRRSIMGISAHAKWLLSGTPLLDMFSDVKSMAELIGIKLGTHDYVSMPNDVFRKAIADMTEAEKFLVYEPPPSAMWIKRRDGLAQQFLNQFLRKDEASYAEIPTLTSMELVHQSAAERAAYIDVEYHLAVNEFRVPSGFKGDNDYDAQLRSSFFGYKHGEEALLWRAAQFNHGLANNDDIYEDEDSPVLSACDTIVSARVETYEELCNKFQVLVERAEVLQRHFLEVIKQQSGTNNCDHYIEFKRRINVSSDLEAKTRILELVTDAEIEAKNKTTKDIEILQDTKYVRLDKLLLVGKIQSRGKTMPAVEFYLRQTATELSRLLVGLVRQVRLIRLAKAISLFQKQLNPSDFCKNCQKSGVDIKIVWQCGHLVCGECMKQSACPADGCNATSTGFLPVSSKEFTIRNSATMDTTDAIWGSKIEKLLRLLEDIQEKGERVLLFVQDVQAIKMIEETLRLYNISVERLDTAGASKRLIEFNKNKTTVLILNVGGESAAGCNLTSANHIIFFSPYLTRGSAALTTYKAAMEQAIGRAKRFGQDKDVHIYHLLTSHTFDVDLFEERQNVVLVEETSGAIIPKPRDDWPESSCQTTYSSHLAGMVLERNAS